MHLSKSRSAFNLIFIFLPVLYGFLLASLPNELFRDRLNYIIYAEDFELIANS